MFRLGRRQQRASRRKSAVAASHVPPQTRCFVTRARGRGERSRVAKRAGGAGYFIEAGFCKVPSCWDVLLLSHACVMFNETGAHVTMYAIDVHILRRDQTPQCSGITEANIMRLDTNTLQKLDNLYFSAIVVLPSMHFRLMLFNKIANAIAKGSEKTCHACICHQNP